MGRDRFDRRRIDLDFPPNGLIPRFPNQTGTFYIKGPGF